MEMKKQKVCPKCRTLYLDTPKIKYCVCGHKFEVIFFPNMEQMLKDPLGFDIREELNRND